jgi:hypothetical protein
VKQGLLLLESHNKSMPVCAFLQTLGTARPCRCALQQLQYILLLLLPAACGQRQNLVSSMAPRWRTWDMQCRNSCALLRSSRSSLCQVGTAGARSCRNWPGWAGFAGSGP